MQVESDSITYKIRRLLVLEIKNRCSLIIKILLQIPFLTVLCKHFRTNRIKKIYKNKPFKILI